MTLRPFISFYGGKWRAAKHYPTPTHDRLIEPFAGGAGYSLRHPERQVNLYDVDPIIAAIWRYLIGATSAEIMRLPLHFDHIDDLTIPQEQKWLIGFWLNKGVAAPCNVPSKWMRDPVYSRQFWGEEIRHRVASQVDSIRHWTITEASYADVPNVDASWFIDPPYQGACGRHYRRSDVDYRHLALWCQMRRGQVIVCEQKGADWLPFETVAIIKAMEGGNGKKVSHEVAWLNDSARESATRLFA